MALKKGKNSDNLNILEDIYEDSPSQEDPLVLPQKSATFREYFNNKEKVDRLLVVATLFFGLAAVGLGFLKFNSNVSSAFVVDNSNLEEIGLDNLNSPEEDLLGLREKDTDEDGLSDYDELYAYATSPFLPDSDSDGIGDQKEIADSTDPNCPTGKNCFSLGLSSPEGADLEQSKEYADLLLGSGDKIANLRLVLQQTGLSEAELSEFSNEELLQVYQELLLDASGVPSTTPSSIGTEGPVIQNPVPEDLASLTPDQLRNLLRLSGVSENILSSVSDGELLNLVKETSQNNLDQ